MNSLVHLALAAALLMPAAARAQDLFVYGGAELTFDLEPDGAGSDNKTALSSYIEIEKAGLYAGIFGEVSSASIENEVDLYFGYRSETEAGFSYDLGYSRYFYPNDGGDCCGEVTLSLGAPISDSFAATLDLAYDPVASLGNAYVEVEYYATDTITVSANYGVYEVDGAGSEQEWDLGVGYALNDETAVDVRYYDGTEYVDSYFGLSLTYDTTIFSR